MRWLSLSDSGVGPEDLAVIGLLLQGNSSATALDLSLNLIAGEKGEVITSTPCQCRHSLSVVMLQCTAYTQLTPSLAALASRPAVQLPVDALS